MLLYAVLLGPICEELVFRGLTFELARKAIPFPAANFLQACLFGIMHMNMMQGIYAFLFGLVLGYLMEKTGNLLITILVHIAYNGSSYLISVLDFEFPNTDNLTFVLLLGSLMSIYIGSIIITNAKETEA